MEFPGFIDVHVHFRDPGVPEAETTASGLAAAARGGFAAVVTMPNTLPACDSPEGIAYQISRVGGSTRTKLFPSACITKGRLGGEVADLESLAAAGAAFFTDDGSNVSSPKVLEEAMRRAAALGMCICDHAMDPAATGAGVMSDSALARRLGLPVIPEAAETIAVERDIAVCRVTGCRLHIQHISTAGGVALVRAAQAEGLPVTAEATPHHLLFCCEEIPGDDANYKMAPPIGTREDRAELRRAVKDGVLMFATDHAPHPAAKKAQGFGGSANGIIGLETAVAATWAAMVEEEGMAPDKWAEAWWKMPRTLFPASFAAALDALPKTEIEVGEKRPFDLSASASLSRNCPYDAMEFACWPRTM